MKQRTCIAATLTLVALVTMAIPTAVAQGQLAPGPTLIYQTKMPVSAALAAFDLINLVLDFAPGAWTPLHSHGGQGIVTVLDGEVTHRPHGGDERRVVAGDSFVETPGHPHRAGNPSSSPARVAFTILLPKGEEVTIVEADQSGQPAGPAPQLVYRTEFAATTPPAEFELNNLVLDFAPGAWTPLHSHGGQGIVTVLEGEIVHQPHGGADRRVAAGESFVETPGHAHRAGNVSGAKTRVLFTMLLPPGAALTTVHDAPSETASPATMPETGVAAMPTRTWLAVIAGAALLVGGWRLQRKRNRA